MNPGKLDSRVSLRQLETTIDSIGGVISGWSHVAYVWGEWLPEKGREFIVAQTRVAEAVGVLRIRYRSDVEPTWRVFVDGGVYEVAAPPVRVGRRSFLDLILKSVPASDQVWPLSNVFDVTLATGDVGKTIKFPAAFKTTPAAVYVQLIVPGGAGSFPVEVVSYDTTGVVLSFGAAVPSAGYKISVQAFQYESTFYVDLVDGTSSQSVTFAVAFPRAPRGLKVTLAAPSDGYDFTTALVVKSLTATGFDLEYGAVVPGPGYKVLVQVSL